MNDLVWKDVERSRGLIGGTVKEFAWKNWVKFRNTAGYPVSGKYLKALFPEYETDVLTIPPRHSVLTLTELLSSVKYFSFGL
jgi:hypothetical protein